MRKSHLFATALVKSGAVRLANTLWGPNRLTVLAYHRIADAFAPDFRYYRHSASATPELFREQMAFVAKHFNVIDLTTLREYILHNCRLPSRPLLITFDDGYADNYTNAFPILRDLGLPAVIFLITGRVDDPAPPWWDLCAYYFLHTLRERAQIPFMGEQDLSTPRQRDLICRTFGERLKRVPEIYKQRAISELPSILDVPPPDAHESLFVSWDQVRELVANGIACQPHTVTHPILSQIEYAEMYRQLTESRARIEAETGQTATTFAYPNGMPGDYTGMTLRALREAGYSMAFTHRTGPMHLCEAQQHPMEIARIPIDHGDTFEMFVMKVMGTFTRWQRASYVLDGVESRNRPAPEGSFLPRFAHRRNHESR
jgi:peptidoglycan/xylan/chitin deacetylase (PgdA/CDA1 family)